MIQLDQRSDVLLVIDPANRRSIPLPQIMDAYGLTQAEARVALAASSGNTVVETAQLLKLSPNTIKTHLRRVFAKTAKDLIEQRILEFLHNHIRRHSLPGDRRAEEARLPMDASWLPASKLPASVPG